MLHIRSKVKAIKQNVSFMPDESRVIAKRLHLEKERRKKIIDRICHMPEEKRKRLLDEILKNFKRRHKNLERILKNNFDKVITDLDAKDFKDLSIENKLLIGAYFTNEYSIEAAALFNPSIVADPFQNHTKPGELKVIISFRAVGEGHMSSVVFRNGILNKHGNIRMSEMSHVVERADLIESPEYNKENFIMKMKDINEFEPVKDIFDQLLNDFNLKELNEAVDRFKKTRKNKITEDVDRAIQSLYWLARSNYEIEFDSSANLSERVIFPRAQTDIKAIEDVRFTPFNDEKGNTMYCGTYTAYNGFSILPQLLETRDFYNFRIRTLTGPGSQNKGMALFPEKINGKYAMISRNDNVNIYIMYSDNIYYWENPKLLREPRYEWEFVQIGNSGPPLKTEKGWLVLTHAVGPMRTYTIGAILLDLKDPLKIIGEIREPILVPKENERNGYVPNVVYSCGGIIHNNYLILPYAASDTYSGIVKFKLNELLENMSPPEN